jgi:predicted nucleic acid-binding protein
MLCFPSKNTMALELAEAETKGECQLFICDTVANELREVVERNFPKSLLALEPFLEAYGVTKLGKPSQELLESCREICVDPDDAAILAAAVQSAKLFDLMLLLSNDFETFHTDKVKAFLLEHEMVPVSLYGLLKILGYR